MFFSECREDLSPIFILKSWESYATNVWSKVGEVPSVKARPVQSEIPRSWDIREVVRCYAHESKHTHWRFITSKSKIRCGFMSWILVEISWIFKRVFIFELENRYSKSLSETPSATTKEAVKKLQEHFPARSAPNNFEDTSFWSYHAHFKISLKSWYSK